jgi:chromosome segregation and condensation protein ScpB
LSEDMSGGPAGHADLLTVLAALLHAGTPLTADQLASALDWPADRVMDALRLAEKHPDLADPVALEYSSGRYSVVARTERLTPEQLGRLTQ